MRTINPAKAGFSVGAVVGLSHLMWVTLVALAWAKPFMDFILRLHFIQLQFDIAPFVLGTAVTLVAITFCFGAFFGFVFALIWNWLAAGKAETSHAPAAART